MILILVALSKARSRNPRLSFLYLFLVDKASCCTMYPYFCSIQVSKSSFFIFAGFAWQHSRVFDLRFDQWTLLLRNCATTWGAAGERAVDENQGAGSVFEEIRKEEWYLPSSFLNLSLCDCYLSQSYILERETFTMFKGRNSKLTTSLSTQDKTTCTKRSLLPTLVRRPHYLIMCTRKT